MPVAITGDPGRLLEPGEFDCVVGAVPDYVPAIQRIKQSVAAEEPLCVLARDATCAAWLQRFAASYSGAVVRYSVVTARDLLGQQWQTEVPADVTDESILTSKLLEADIVPRTRQSYEEIVLEHYWGEFFTFVRFPLRLAGELIDSLDPSRWEVNRRLPLVMQALHACQERWLTQARRRELKDLIHAVMETPGALKGNLARYKLVRGYPAQLGRAVLGDWHALFKNLAIDPTPVGLDALDLSDTIQQIHYYLNGLSSRIATEADLEAVLDEMSGFLFEEFDWLAEQLQDKGERFRPAPHLLQRIRDRFRPIQDQIETHLAALEAAIPPAYPSDPSKNQTVEDWLRWAVSDYFPYRFWLEDNDRWDQAIARYASTYADWFFNNYTNNKHQHQRQWVFNLLSEIGASLAARRKVLFIVVDNFNFKYVRSLLDRFNRRGFRVVAEVAPVWAPIPTTTEVSKWCLVAGEPDLSAVQGRNYEDILDKDWQGYFEDYRVGYLSKLGSLKMRRQFNEDLLLLNYLPIDTVLHKDEGQIATTHTAEIEGCIQNLVQVVSQFAKRTRVEQELDIYITSDHGSTKIPPGIRNALDDNFYRERAEDRHRRYISVPEERAVNPTSYDQEHCYIVRADAFGTRENYFIARGYDRFIETQRSIYVHGGLTPEETIVPFCKLMKTEIEMLQPTIRLPDNVVRYSVISNLVFVVGNPNDYDITNVELNVVESDLPGAFVEAIPAGLSPEITIAVRIKRRPGIPDLEAITVEGAFQLQGQRFTFEPVGIAVEARSLMESKTDLDLEF